MTYVHLFVEIRYLKCSLDIIVRTIDPHGDGEKLS